MFWEAEMKIIKRIGLDLVKGAIAALAALAGLIMSGMITPILGLPTPEIPPQVEMGLLLPRMFLTLVVISIVLGECFQKLYASYWRRFIFIWLCNYILYYLLNTLDGLLFSPFPNMSTGIVSNIFPALTMATLVAWLWRPKAADSQDRDRVRTYFATRRPVDWAWRLAVAWLVYPPIYYLMGLVIAPVVKPYYEDPTLNLGLTLPPSVEILISMQVVRGLLFLAAVLPIIIAWQGPQSRLWLWVGTVIFIQIAGQIIFQTYWLPAGLRITHCVELLVDSFVQAAIYTLLLGLPMKVAENIAKSPEPVASHPI